MDSELNLSNICSEKSSKQCLPTHFGFHNFTISPFHNVSCINCFRIRAMVIHLGFLAANYEVGSRIYFNVLFCLKHKVNRDPMIDYFPLSLSSDAQRPEFTFGTS